MTQAKDVLECIQHAPTTTSDICEILKSIYENNRLS